MFCIKNVFRLEIAQRIEEENRLEALEAANAESRASKYGPTNSSSRAVNNSVPSSTTKEVLEVHCENFVIVCYLSRELIITMYFQVLLEDGWTPEITQSFGIISDHPIIQQINIIKGYIKQAESANRTGEVATLQQNLRDLEEEFWRQTKESYAETPKK